MSNELAASELVAAELQKKGLDFLIANDLPRVWTTGAQVFVNAGHVMMVFREQALLNNPEAGSSDVLIKNVGSLIMPADVAVQFHKLLGEQLAANGFAVGE